MLDTEAIRYKVDKYNYFNDIKSLLEVVDELKEALKKQGIAENTTSVVDGSCKCCGEKILPYMDYCCGCGRKIEPEVKW